MKLMYSNDTNSDYVKIVQAIDLLDSVDLI